MAIYFESSKRESPASVDIVPPRQGATMLGVPFEKRDVVRVGFIGLGGRGYGQLKEMLAVEGAQITAINDISQDNITRARDEVVEKGQPEPAIETDWQRLCERSDVDLVYTCSPWNMHVPVAVYAMECGKHVAVEVPAATTIEGCWKLVDTSERTRKHCIMLENCCYGAEEMLALSMVRKGLLGTITHGEAAYIHDLRAVLLGDTGEGLWRREPHKTRDANLYPTHGLGPVAWYMNVNRGDRFTKIVSMSSLSASLSEYRDATLAKDDPKLKETYSCGDMNLSFIQTEMGRTILLEHDVVSPRPYSRLNLVQGTKGVFSGWPHRVYLDGKSEEHKWEELDAYKEQYQHSLWRKHGEKALELGGHGGMDFIMNYRLIQLYRNGMAPDIDVYDAAAWSAPCALSEISITNENIPLSFPDFTRGNWKEADTRAQDI
ncbi:MAG TPA: glycosyl hydrolase [Armatimonadetes bacterium]|jgi:predicted dehydrogenase|nr:glycosyl hydrolase [Armatimonadota bacterium]